MCCGVFRKRRDGRGGDLNESAGAGVLSCEHGLFVIAVAVAMGRGAEQSIAVDGVTGQTREDLVKLL